MLDNSVCEDFIEITIIRSATSCSDFIVCGSGIFFEAFFCQEGFWFNPENQVNILKLNYDNSL